MQICEYFHLLHKTILVFIVAHLTQTQLTSVDKERCGSDSPCLLISGQTAGR